jgi:2-dehydropantoate 2-reductase
MIIPQQPTTLGEIEGPPTPRIREIAAMLKKSRFNVALSQNMDAWLKTHAVFVTAVCGALYCAGADNYELARSSEIMVLFVKGVREGLKSLQALGLPPPPLNLRAIFDWMPRGIAIAYWRRFFGSERGKYYFAEHARVAWEEMKMLSDEVRALPGMGASVVPSFDLLCGAIDAYAGRMSASTLNLGFAH